MEKQVEKDYNDLKELFEKRVDFDRELLSNDLAKLTKKKIPKEQIKEFLEKSHFHAYPPISYTPKYCLVALEPNYGLKETENEINYHFTGSQRTLLLNFLVYELCGNKFDYHLTDICKTPMSSGLANKVRKDLYAYKEENIQSWYELFEQEIQLFKDVKIIPIGATVEKYLQNVNNICLLKPIFHYGTQLNATFNEEFEKRNLSLETVNKADFIENLVEFSKKLFIHLNFDKAMIDKKIDILFQKGVSDFIIKKYLVYTEQFKEIAKDN